MAKRKIRRALLSVSDKTNLIDFARALSDHGVDLISTGGTSRELKDAGLQVRDVSDVTGFPEILDGRVKTLHPRIHAGILAIRDNAEHEKTLQEQQIAPIDMVVCNLYPFEATVARADASHEEIIENIDIGGPSMVRAAAKNHRDVAIVTSPQQYEMIHKEMADNDGGLTLETREKLASAAYARTAAYDAAVSAYFQRKTGEAPFPEHLALSFQKRLPLRYGENPHQQAAFYAELGLIPPGIASAEQLHGKELSFNNILDLDSAFNLVREFESPAAVVLKHNNPCGGAAGVTLEEAFCKAYDGDPLSAFGGILGFNREVDEATARQITEPNRFIECIVAPSYSKAAFELLTTRPSWKKNVRILQTGPLSTTPAATAALDYRRIAGGLLAQSRDVPADELSTAVVKTKRAPTEAELRDLHFAWLVGKHVKSNAIVLAKDGMIVGVGAGQMSRVDSVHMAVRKAGDRVKGAVMASDAFFPFRDNIDEAAKAGVSAVIQPGGSKRDQDSINACDENNMAMLFTGVRHFRH